MSTAAHAAVSSEKEVVLRESRSYVVRCSVDQNSDVETVAAWADLVVEGANYGQLFREHHIGARAVHSVHSSLSPLVLAMHAA